MRQKKATKEELERKRRLAFTLYVDNGFEQKLIADITGISEKTISAWKKKSVEEGNDWDEERRAALLGPEKQMRRIMKMYDNTLTQIEERPAPKNVPTAAEGDTLNKLSLSAKNLQADLNLFVKAQVGKQYIGYVQQVHGQAKAIEAVELWHEFQMATS